MASNPLTREELAAMRELVDAGGAGGSHWDGCSAAHPLCAVAALLAALDEANAENERMRKALGVIAKYDSDRQPGCEHCCSDIARTALEPRP